MSKLFLNVRLPAKFKCPVFLAFALPTFNGERSRDSGMLESKIDSKISIWDLLYSIKPFEAMCRGRLIECTCANGGTAV